MTVQESAAATRREIRIILDQRLPRLVERAWPAYLAATKTKSAQLNPFSAGKLHVQMRQAAIEVGFNYEDAGAVARRVVETRQRGDIAAVPEALDAFIRPAFDLEIEEDWHPIKKGVMLAALARIERNLNRPLDEYAKLILALSNQMERIQETTGLDKAMLIKRVAEVSEVPEKLVWRVAGGGKRVILTHVNRIAKALNRIEAVDG